MPTTWRKPQPQTLQQIQQILGLVCSLGGGGSGVGSPGGDAGSKGGLRGGKGKKGSKNNGDTTNVTSGGGGGGGGDARGAQPAAKRAVHNYVLNGKKFQHTARNDDWACGYQDCPVVTNRASHRYCFGCKRAWTGSDGSNGSGKKTANLKKSDDADVSKGDAATGADSCLDGEIQAWMMARKCTSTLSEVKAIATPTVATVTHPPPPPPHGPGGGGAHTSSSSSTAPSSAPTAAAVAQPPPGDQTMTGGGTDGILSSDDLRLAKAMLISPIAEFAALATARIKKHEEALQVRAAAKTAARVDLATLSPKQGVEHCAAELQGLRKEEADALAHWTTKSAEDDAEYQLIKDKCELEISRAQQRLGQATEWHTVNKAKYQAQHNVRLREIRARMDTMEVKLAQAKLAEVQAGELANVPPAARAKDDIDDEVTTTTMNATELNPTEKVADDAMGVPATMRPAAVPPQLEPLTDEAQLQRLAFTKGVLDAAAQQDAWIDLSLGDLGIDLVSAIKLIGEGEWRDKFPLDEFGLGDLAADHPIPKRLIAILAKAVGQLEVQTALSQQVAASAMESVTKAAQAAKMWKLQAAGRRKGVTGIVKK